MLCYVPGTKSSPQGPQKLEGHTRIAAHVAKRAGDVPAWTADSAGCAALLFPPSDSADVKEGSPAWTRGTGPQSETHTKRMPQSCGDKWRDGCRGAHVRAGAMQFEHLLGR